MRTKIVAGNWKMNLDWFEASDLVEEILEYTEDITEVKIIFAPSYPLLEHTAAQISARENMFVAAQNCSHEPKGAFTGEVSAAILDSLDLSYVIIGHSERRKHFHETDEILVKKVNLCMENGLVPIFCCGETLEQRNHKKEFDIIRSQLTNGLFHLSDEQILKTIIAYEPVWAIGTGVTAAPEQAQEMHQYIRTLIKGKYDDVVSDNVSILYGGSVTHENASALFACPDVDGGLVGGASLKAKEFVKIIEAMERWIDDN